MSKEKIVKDGYNQLNTPVVTYMCNLMQWIYSDPQMRGQFDKLMVKGEERKVSPLLSAFQAFIITTAMSMRAPGQEKITIKSNDELKLAIDHVIMSLESFLILPSVRSSLINGLDMYISNGKFETKPVPDEHADVLFGKRPN
tara:strand:+ start:156 stop:581 length:426 start_codon:yes stop_codon:yes gene_type:complete